MVLIGAIGRITLLRTRVTPELGALYPYLCLPIHLQVTHKGPKGKKGTIMRWYRVDFIGLKGFRLQVQRRLSS